MAFARVQGNSANSGSGSAASLGVTIAAVGSGNAICGIISWHTGAPSLTSVTDDKGNTYNLETTVLDTTDLLSSAAFSLTNIINAPATITANFSAGVTFRQILVDEFSGASTASSDERNGAAHGGQFQNNPGTATDGITSGPFTTTVDGDLIWGATVDGAGTLALASNGTSFSTGTQFNATDYASQTEFRTQATAASGTAATFTQLVDVPRTTFMIAIKAPQPAAVTPSDIHNVEFIDKIMKDKNVRPGLDAGQQQFVAAAQPLPLYQNASMPTAAGVKRTRMIPC